MECYNAKQRANHKFENLTPLQKQKQLQCSHRWQKRCYIPVKVRKALSLSLTKSYYANQESEKYLEQFKKLREFSDELVLTLGEMCVGDRASLDQINT